MSRAGTIAVILTLAASLGLAGCFRRNEGEHRDPSLTFPPRPVSQAVTLHRSRAPRIFAKLAAGADDTLHLAWIELGQGASQVMTRRLSEGAWLPATPGVETRSAAMLTEAAVDRGGRLHALYLTRHGGFQQVYHASRNGHGWSTPRELTVGNASAYSARLAIDGLGTLHAVWQAAEQHNAAVIYRARDGADWGEGQQITPKDPRATFWKPGLAVGPDNTLHVTYFALTMRGTAVYYIRKDPAGRWEAARQLSKGLKFAISPRIAVDRFGNPHVVWRGGTDNKILYYTAQKDGEWSTPVAVATRSNPPRNVSLAVDDQGLAYLAWQEETGQGRSDIFLSRGRETQWSQPGNVSNGAGVSYAATAKIVGTTLHLAWTEASPNGKGSEIRWLAVPLSSPAG